MIKTKFNTLKITVMKIKSIIAATLVATLALASCAKDGGNSSVKGDKETKSFFIKIGQDGPVSRSEGADMSNTRVTFSDGYLIFTTGDNIGRVIKIVADNPAAGEVTVAAMETGAVIGEIPASTKNVYLYGNLGGSPDGMAAAAVEGGSLAAVQALVWTLSDIQSSANDVSKVPVYGKGDVKPGTSEPDRLESSFKVSPVGSRLQIGSVSCDDDRVTELLLAGIYINGFYHSMKTDGSFDTSDFVDNGIDTSRYPAGGYSNYASMSDVITPVNLKVDDAVPTTTGNYWAYNFFPAPMPHIVLHFSSMKVEGMTATGDMYATVAKYSKSASGGTGNEVTEAEAANVYTLDIIIDDYEKQITELPEESSFVTGYVKIEIVHWKGNTIYPEW